MPAPNHNADISVAHRRGEKRLRVDERRRPATGAIAGRIGGCGGDETAVDAREDARGVDVERDDGVRGRQRNPQLR